MARQTFEAWIPEEYESAVYQRVRQLSAVEALARRIPMGSQTKSTPRSGGMGLAMVAKGGTYSEDTSANDEVILRAQKFGNAVRIAEEDIDDSLADIVNTKLSDWATSYAKGLDNACLGVSVARGTSGCAFDSVYYQLTQANAATGYTANANLIKSAGDVTYKKLSQMLSLLETGDYWDEANLALIAHPAFKAITREILDNNGRPILNESSNGTAGGGQGATPDRLFGYPVHWSLGARTSTTVTANPTGNPLLFAANTDFLQLGVRSGPESIFIDGRPGLSALTDESILKMRSRRGFALGHEKAVSALEVTAA